MVVMSAHEHPYKHQMPPSPPPSPPSARHRQKKKHDPFEELARTPIPSRPATPVDHPDEQDSLVTRIILTPVLFISFLLSLCLVNYRDRARRATAHSFTPSILNYLTPWTWLDPEPYQNPADSTWNRRGGRAGHVLPHDAIGPNETFASKSANDGDMIGKKKQNKRRSWHLNKKIRRMTKLEVSDAFEMRGKVIVGMMVIMCLACIGMWFGMKWTYMLMSSVLGRIRS